MQEKHTKILIKDSTGIILVSGILLHIPSVKFKIFILPKVIAKTLHILSILLKNLRGQNVQTEILQILQLNQFERPERLIGCMNYEQFFHMVLVTGQGMNLKLIINTLMLLLKFHLCLVCKRFYASVITRELTLNNNSSTDIYNNTNGLSANDIIDKNMRN